jgi:16S rRNA (guanine1516-N2)-methyltransferase
VREATREFALLLVVTSERLELRQTDTRTGAVSCDFATAAFERRRRGAVRGSLLAKAIGYRGTPLRVIDATAGFGRDAMLLASLGCEVEAVERSPAVAALLEDGLRRAKDVPELEGVARAVRVTCGDARDHLAAHARPDAIYLDPMFPVGHGSALPKKELQVLARLVGEPEDADELLAIALGTGCPRVVVKRPDDGVALSAPEGRRPDVQYRGKTVRFDVYVTPA